MKDQLKKLEKDLHRLSKHWKEVIVNHNLLEESKFLSTIAEDVIDLESDLELCEGLHPLGDGVELIHYLINTTWGAPFVFNTPLLEAAQSYKPEKYRDSQLRALMGEFVQYHEELNEQLFNCLEEIQTQIRNLETS